MAKILKRYSHIPCSAEWAKKALILAHSTALSLTILATAAFLPV
jgi:hypothetical protein